jgi:hypothetical protein
MRHSHRKIKQATRPGRTIVDFGSLSLPSKLGALLAEAFQNHIGIRSRRCVLTQWAHVRTFDRFVTETGALRRVEDLDRTLLVRYIEWLNAQRRAHGAPWTKSSRSGAYTTLRTLLQWLQRCRPAALGEIEFPFNPFPWRNRDTRPREPLSAAQLRAILSACEREIAEQRAKREHTARERARARVGRERRCQSLGSLLECIDQRFGGIIPSAKALSRAGHHPVREALKTYGGLKQVAPYLYPTPASLLPYYLAILIHTAGNPEPITQLACDCLQPLPLLGDRELLVWVKHRADAVQQRSFRTADPFAPPALVRELLEQTRFLRARAPASFRARLFLFRGSHGIGVLSTAAAKQQTRAFTRRHGLAHFALAVVRPSVLTAFYRVSGDVRQVRAVANHASIATTVGYLQNSTVRSEHRVRIGALQAAFLGHIERPGSRDRREPTAPISSPTPQLVLASVSAPAVSMFGFDCKDPFAGIAPGTHRGQLCTHFLGCFNCPNAIIPADPATIARLLQARDHLRGAAAHVHPARWEAIYAPPLRILEEDILTRFGAHELSDAKHCRSALPPLPPLR